MDKEWQFAIHDNIQYISKSSVAHFATHSEVLTQLPLPVIHLPPTRGPSHSSSPRNAHVLPAESLPSFRCHFIFAHWGWGSPITLTHTHYHPAEGLKNAYFKNHPFSHLRGGVSITPGLLRRCLPPAYASELQLAPTKYSIINYSCSKRRSFTTHQGSHIFYSNVCHPKKWSVPSTWASSDFQHFRFIQGRWKRGLFYNFDL